MPYTTTDFETKLALVSTAIDDEDRSAAYKAYAQAKVIHAALALNATASAGDRSLTRSQSLADLGAALDSAFDAISQESDNGGATENFFAAPTLGDA